MKSSNSYLPKIELPMDYIYDGEYEWPSERLYRHLRQDIIDKEKKFRKSRKWV